MQEGEKEEAKKDQGNDVELEKRLKDLYKENETQPSAKPIGKPKAEPVNTLFPDPASEPYNLAHSTIIPNYVLNKEDCDFEDLGNELQSLRQNAALSQSTAAWEPKSKLSSQTENGKFVP